VKKWEVEEGMGGGGSEVWKGMEELSGWMGGWK